MADPLTITSLPEIGRLRYGDVVRSVEFEELLTSKITGQPEWDRARRVVKYTRYTLEVDGYVIAKNSQRNDPTWSEMRTVLQTPGLTLEYSDRGFGNFTINAGVAKNSNDVHVRRPTGLVDVCQGPHPELLEFTPLGAGLAARVVWKCEVCLPELLAEDRNGPGFPQGMLAFNWSSNLSFGDDGYAEYTVEGELEIARVVGDWLNEAGGPVNIEDYRAYTEPQLQPGFRPKKRVFRIDDAKRKIEFHYSFEEMGPMGIPAGCTKAGGNYVVSSKGGTASINWQASLSAHYTTVPTGPRRDAYLRFLGLWRDRLNHISTSVTPTSDAGSGDFSASPIVAGGALGAAAGSVIPVLGTAAGFGVGIATGGIISLIQGPIGAQPLSRPTPVVRKFVINEGLYEDSKVSSFEATWTFATNFASIFQASGAWRKMSDCAYQRNAAGRDVWVAGMASVVGYTSWYDYGFQPQAEVIVSPNQRIDGITEQEKEQMTGATRISDFNRITAGAGLDRSGVDPDTGESPDQSMRLWAIVEPETSWLNYQLEFITDLDPGMALHKPLPQTQDDVDTLGSYDVFSKRPEANTGSVNTISKSTGKDILQRMATSTYRVAMRGFGVRAGHKVPVPDLKVFGGVPVSPGRQRVIGPRIIGNYSGIPIYMTAWELWYDVPEPPRSQQAAPPNLEQHIGDVHERQLPDRIAVPVSIPEPPIQRARFPRTRPRLRE